MKKYQLCLRHIIENGISRKDRTGVGTVGVFGYQERFSLSDGFPLLTTKKMAIKSIISELLFFMQKIPDRRLLQQYMVGKFDDNSFDIWKGNCEDAKEKNN